ncbi:Phosphate uptake regulator, PhoU [groundwater metagenome]|uniref:Phosphate uptake regulator, PhoU n=1 Tax=groundwater metagenome TaxID=717931 RepID=A0A098E5Z5_9ZZZZ
MESRKIQFTGKSSYIVSLPKDWVESQGIKKNDSVIIIPHRNGTLMLMPKAGKKRIETREIDVDIIEDNETLLFRILISAYINGYSNIILKSKKEISPMVRNCAIKFAQSAIGPEIIDEDDATITIKDLLDPCEMPFDKTIKRMYTLTKAMHESAMSAIRNNDKETAKKTIEMDTDVDRLHWFVSRQFNILLKNMEFSEKMGLTQNEGVYYFLISRLIERIADHAVKIARASLFVMDEGISADMAGIMSSQSETALKIFGKSFDAWTKKDINLANKNIDSIEKLISGCETINKEILKKNYKSATYMSDIVESIRRTGEYSADMSEITINYHLVGNKI